MAEKFCLVIMPFSDELKDTYDDAIKPAVEAEGLKCIRVDEISGTGNIVRRIVECVHEAAVVVADLTGRNANVFYELGMAHALGNNVIVLAQDIMRDVPFDVANYKVIQYRTQRWRDALNLKEQLQESIRTLDQWSKKPSNPVQDFLPEDARPLPASWRKETEAELQKAQAEARRLAAEAERLSSEKSALEKEMEATAAALAASRSEAETLKQENAQLEGMKKMKDAMSRFMRREVPEFGEGADFDSEFDKFIEELGRKGEVTVGDAKIEFRRV